VLVGYGLPIAVLLAPVVVPLVTWREASTRSVLRVELESEQAIVGIVRRSGSHAAAACALLLLFVPLRIVPTWQHTIGYDRS
jgi:hypothetical protein